MKKVAPAVLGALVLLLATACGGSDTDQLDATITGNVAKAISTPGGILDEDDAACVAKRFVDELGSEKLQEAKVVTEDGSYNENGANVDADTSAVYAEALTACVDLDAATEKIRTSLIAGASISSLEPADAKCFVTKLVDTVDIEHLLSSKIVTDSGEFNQNAAEPDVYTATRSAKALLACVDYYALYAKARAAEVKNLDTAQFVTCLRAKLPKPLLTEFLIAITAVDGNPAPVTARVSKVTDACAKTATPK